MTTWKKYKLSALTEIIGGGTPKTSIPGYWNGNIPWLSVVDFCGDLKKVYKTEKTITEKGLKESSTKILRKGQIIISARGTVGELAMLGGDMAFNQSCYGLNGVQGKIINNFLYYLVKYNLDSIKRKTHGAVFDTITKQTFDQIEVDIPDLPTQSRIASILSSLDDKIELNRRMNKTLEQMAQALFNHCFVDNIDPDNLPEGWRWGSLKEIATNFDSKRVPLSSREREERTGPYPYYGAASLMGYVDSYIFDGVYILLGEDGTVIDKNGYPILQYIWNKFWVNNHAHVLQGKGCVSTNHLYLILKSSSVSHLVSGAVQPKINQSNLNSLNVLIADEKTCLKFSAEIENLFALIRTNTVEINTLKKIRNILLPKLMSGEINVDGLMKEEKQRIENLETA